jgi:phosphoglycerate dehydrogenase-like enzyme
MQVLMSEAAFGRVSTKLAAMGEGLDVVTIDPSGALKRAGVPIDGAEVDPEVFWASLDLYSPGQQTPQLMTFFGRILQGAKGQWVQSFAAGVDSPVFKAVMGKGLRLSKSSAQAPAIAEYVMAQALSLLHPIAEQRGLQKDHDWRYVHFREIGSTRWLMVGFGAIGHEIARRLHPFGAPLTVVRRNTAPEPLAADVRPTRDLSTLLPDADVVVLACALNDETRGLAGDSFFKAMKPGSLLINIARGGLIDEAALKAGLDRDQPGRAVLDVFETEPLPAEHWLWDHPKVRVTGHCSNAGDGVLGRGDALFLENLRRYRAGEPLLNETHPSEVGL